MVGDGAGDGQVGAGEVTPPVALRVVAPHMVAGLLLNVFGNVCDCAPILHYMRGWSEKRVRAYVKQKRWTIDWSATL